MNEEVLMLYIAVNIRSLRKSVGLTQDEIAEMLSVSPQSVSKWERGDTYPDITFLPALANLFKTSIDSLVGMDKINDAEARSAIFRAEHECLQAGELREAARILEDARKTFPNDVSLLSELALILSLFPDPEALKKSVAFCEQVLAGNPSEKVRYTIRAAICFIYLKLGETQKAQASAQNLPHVRESREIILAQIQDGMTPQQIDTYLRLITLGE
jgi:transcriptional regulator with XRE-family HTH domain